MHAFASDASGAAAALDGSKLLGRYLGDLLRMREVTTILPLIASLEQTAHDVEHEQRGHGPLLPGLQHRGRAEDVRARRDAAEKRECDEERLEICCVASIRGRCDGRHPATVGTAVLASGNDGDDDARAPLRESRAVLEEQVVEGEKHILVLAKVDESHESAPDEGRVMDRRP